LLSTPWAGGLNAVQVNTMDINLDGENDLVLFERTSGAVKVFIHKSGAYYFAPEYLSFFPEVRGWVLLRDFNNDGKKDLFTSHPLGIKVYVNTSTGTNLQWRQYNGGSELLSTGLSGPVNIKLDGDDLPVIDDYDHDGDLDILNFVYLSNTLEFHKNISQDPDSLVFEKISDKWGDFEECNCGEFSFSEPCPPSGGRIDHTSSKALLILDFDGDGDKEIVISEEDCSQAFILDNTGSNTMAVFRNPSDVFPERANPAIMFTYPTVYYEDIDGDDKKDLLISPNTVNNVSRAMNFRYSLRYYKNNGTSNQPKFNLIQKNFLQDQMIDVGENSAPAFFDLDNDGDQDMLIGRFGEYTIYGRSASLYLYKNTGTTYAPAFELVTDDFLGLSEYGFFNIKPQFVDVNGDKNIDLAFTANPVNSNRPTVHYILNKAFWGFDPQNLQVESTEVSLELDENAFFFDVNKDGKAEILIGKQAGNIEVYLNNDYPKARFEKISDRFYGIDINYERAYPAIAIGDLDGNGALDMVTGTQGGKLFIYADFVETFDNPLPGEEITLTTEGNIIIAPHVHPGSVLYPTLVNLYNENKPMLAIGSGQGGVSLLRNDQAQVLPDESSIEIYPNPYGPASASLQFNTSRNIKYELITLQGQKITPLLKARVGETVSINTRDLTSGMYILRVYTSTRSINTKKIVVFN